MFHRTIRMISHGIKPVFVFDGKPPELKSDEVKKKKNLFNKRTTEKQLHKTNFILFFFSSYPNVNKNVMKLKKKEKKLKKLEIKKL